MRRPRNGQWIAIEDADVKVDGVVKPFSEHFPNVAKRNDGKLIGIFSERRRDSLGKIAPAQAVPVESISGANISAINSKTSLPETMAFIEKPAIDSICNARDLMTDPPPPPICLVWPVLESLDIEPVLDREDIPEARRPDESFRLEP